MPLAPRSSHGSRSGHGGAARPREGDGHPVGGHDAPAPPASQPSHALIAAALPAPAAAPPADPAREARPHAAAPPPPGGGFVLSPVQRCPARAWEHHALASWRPMVRGRASRGPDRRRSAGAACRRVPPARPGWPPQRQEQSLRVPRAPRGGGCRPGPQPAPTGGHTPQASPAGGAGSPADGAPPGAAASPGPAPRCPPGPGGARGRSPGGPEATRAPGPGTPVGRPPHAAASPRRRARRWRCGGPRRPRRVRRRKRPGPRGWPPPASARLARRSPRRSTRTPSPQSRLAVGGWLGGAPTVLSTRRCPLHHPVMARGHGLRPQEGGPPPQGGRIRWRGQGDATERAQHQTLGHDGLGLGIAPAGPPLHDHPPPDARRRMAVWGARRSRATVTRGHRGSAASRRASGTTTAALAPWRIGTKANQARGASWSRHIGLPPGQRYQR
jgi:hypothetical protein